MDFLTLDDRHMRVSDAERGALGLDAAHRRLEAIRTEGRQGFFDLPFDLSSAAFLARRASALRRAGIRRLLVVGIGGSSLGARALIEALRSPKRGMDVAFVSAPDPDAYADILPSRTEWKRTALLVVSKSGSTLEPVSVFLALRAALIRSVGAKKHAAHVVVITDPREGNPLLAFARAEGYEVLPHPLNVGGRFSVLSPVGLFPAACAGIDVRRLLSGAQRLEEDRRIKREACLAARFAADQFLAYQAGRTTHVFMPYAARLRLVSLWFRQLWAESLGKDGKGPTPVASVGPDDQHSQLQLYQQGPDDKTLTFVDVERFASSPKVPAAKGADAFAPIPGRSFTDILHAERKGVAEALAEDGRRSATFAVPSISPESVGALLQCLMQAAAFMGELLQVNAFDQPGVEAGKREARKILGAR